jgi:hypothetical protein
MGFRGVKPTELAPLLNLARGSRETSGWSGKDRGRW